MRRNDVCVQAIDEQVDQLASAAAGALGSFWAGLGGAINSGLTAAGLMAAQSAGAAHDSIASSPPPGPYGCAICVLVLLCTAAFASQFANISGSSRSNQASQGASDVQ